MRIYIIGLKLESRFVHNVIENLEGGDAEIQRQ